MPMRGSSSFIVRRRKNIRRWLRSIITNPVAQQMKLAGPKLSADKGDTLRHGIGLTNVPHTVERYHGKLELKCDASQFTFMAIMANERPVMT